VEAPHLSRITQRYEKDGLVVLAVNSRDEPAAEIAQYLDEHDLKLHVLLNGRHVKEHVYGMMGIPMLFWINRTGVVVNTRLGYDEADARKLDEYTQRLVSGTD
jgi:hypothetical protein